MAERAAALDETPDRFVVELLSQQVLPSHPYIETVNSRSGPRAVLKGTRIAMDVVVGYAQAGNSPQEIAEEILPS